MSEQQFLLPIEGAADVGGFLDLCSDGAVGQIVLVTYSGLYGFPSMSGYRSGPTRVDPGSDEVGSWLERLDSRLAEGADVAEAVLSFVAQTTGATARLVTDPPSRPGEVGVAIASTGTDPPRQVVEEVVRAIMSSRLVLFHRESAIDNLLRRAAAPSNARPPKLPTGGLSVLEAALHRERLSNLISTAATAVDVGHFRVFDTDNGHAFAVTDWAPESVLPLDARFPLLEDVATPPPPSRDGPSTTISQLVQASWRRRRRLSGRVDAVDGPYLALTVPFGIDLRSDRPSGVLCHVARYDASTQIGPYELMVGTHLATWLARVSAERRLATTVGQLGVQLAELGNPRRALRGGTRTANTGLLDVMDRCDQLLRPRQDIRILQQSLPTMLSELRRLCSAQSCTFRIVSGDGTQRDGPNRWLRRVFSDGESQWSASPWAISLSESRVSVNAWVATYGLPVYIRSLPVDGTPVSIDNCAELERYEGLDSVASYRTGIRSELCVPVFAEDRLVGTLNIEADRIGAFDEVALSVEEYAQVIGVALLEARRRIAVDIMDTAGGFLDKRHELDGRLANLEEAIDGRLELDVETRGELVSEIGDVREQVFLKVRAPGVSDEPVSIEHTITEALKAANSTYASVPPVEFLAGSAHHDLLTTTIGGVEAESLCFALAQAFYNVRKHRRHRLGRAAEERAGWPYPMRVQLSEILIGGERNILVGVESLLRRSHADTLEVGRLFREPMIDDDGRVRLGAYLAGEVLRRCGGSACARAVPLDDRGSILEVEFAVTAS